MEDEKLPSSWKERIWVLLEAGTDKTSKRFQHCIDALIILNILIVIIGSVEEIYLEYKRTFIYFGLACSAIFIIEYLLRVWSCTTDPRYQGCKGRLLFFINVRTVIDCISIFPPPILYLLFYDDIDFANIYMLRLLRILRVFNILTRTDAFLALLMVIWGKRKEFLIILAFLLSMLVICSSLMYLMEKDVQPQNFGSIPRSLWFGIETLTAVAYGDVFATTLGGKFIAGFFSLIGLGWFALPAGILASGFNEEFKNREDKKSRCPICHSKKGKQRYEPLDLSPETDGNDRRLNELFDHIQEIPNDCLRATFQEVVGETKDN